jgi:bifunctional DNase/RNase
MKIFALLSLLFITHFSFAQPNLPIIKANSKNAFIIEGVEDRQSWGINPPIKPDVHTISKITKPKWIKFYTDIDSIKVKIKPNEHFDFIVLLNGKDSAFTRIESLPIKNYANQRPVTHDTIPFILTEFNNIKIKAIVNRIDTLYLKFDSGTTGLLLTNDAIKQKTHLANNSGKDNTLHIGNLSWSGLEVYPVELSGQGTDGRFGWDLFDGKIVEIDYDKNIFIVHSQLSGISKTYAKLPIEYTHSLFCIAGDLAVKNKKYKNRFLFDNGYQRTIMLDTLLMYEQDYPKDLEVIKKVIMKNGQGKEIPVITVNNEKLHLGREELRNIPVQLMTMGNPARFKTHILGNEVLKRFNTILDFQNNFVYLQPNNLFNLPYTDAK